MYQQTWKEEQEKKNYLLNRKQHFEGKRSISLKFAVDVICFVFPQVQCILVVVVVASLFRSLDIIWCIKKAIIAVRFSWTTSHNLHWRCHLIIFIDDLVESMSFKLYENIITRAMWYNLGVFHLFHQFSDKCKMTWIIMQEKPFARAIYNKLSSWQCEKKYADM